MKPTFLVIGAAKAGTTSLWGMLRQHPDVFLPQRKEPHFFSFERNWARGADWYEAWFDGPQAAAAAQRGEASTSYTVRTLFPDAPARIAAYDPNLKLIYLAREPLARIESAWQQLRRFGPAPAIRSAGLGDVPDAMWVDNSFDRAVRLQSDVLVESTNYLREIDAYRAHFPDEQILVLLFEEFRRDPLTLVRRCFEFLGVEPEFVPHADSEHKNPFGEYPVPFGFLRTFWSSARRRKACAAIVDRLPAGPCERLSKAFLRSRLRERPRWKPETEAWVRARLEPDLVRFLARYGFPSGVWGLDAAKARTTSSGA